MPPLSLPTLVETARLRHALGLLLFSSSLFQLIGLGAHQGWATGLVRTSTAHVLPSVPIPCPPEAASLNATSCSSTQTVTEAIDTSFTYGLFRDLVYTTTTVGEVTTNVFALVNNTSTSKLVRTDIVPHTHTDIVDQDSYVFWAQGNANAIHSVTGAQSFLVLAWWCTFFAWVMLVLGLHGSPHMLVGLARVRLGSKFLLGGAVCLFLTFAVWGGLSTLALTNLCVPGDQGGVVCTQLLSDTCDALLAQDPKAWCQTNAEVNKRAGVWGLIFFTWLLHLCGYMLWRQLDDAVVSSEEEVAFLQGGSLTAPFLGAQPGGLAQTEEEEEERRRPTAILVP